MLIYVCIKNINLQVFGYYISSEGNSVLKDNVWVEPNSTLNDNGKKVCILHTTHFSEFGLMLFSELLVNFNFNIIFF